MTNGSFVPPGTTTTNGKIRSLIPRRRPRELSALLNSLCGEKVRMPEQGLPETSYFSK
jgi:hypothetical protein